MSALKSGQGVSPGTRGPSSDLCCPLHVPTAVSLCPPRRACPVTASGDLDPLCFSPLLGSLSSRSVPRFTETVSRFLWLGSRDPTREDRRLLETPLRRETRLHGHFSRALCSRVS